jgi:2-amino-4-hydroxy-6-hydroxymethyldihydropteridine diphosphokinase
MAQTVFLSLGSNIGDREKNLINAVKALSYMEGFELVSHSPIYLSQAVEMDENAPGFLNMVVKGEFAYRPTELLNNIEKIERQMGRTDKGEYKPRSIDIDILLFGDEIIETDRLSVPHRKLTLRPFILMPLLQIEPDIVHPVTKEKMDTYLDSREAEDIILYKEFDRINV